ncbi:unnamed protein product [Adineta ricciae]|uniref:Uncharacterized protein n=1 Tax=Adineta ricciae TaxID=249248 RepID=A0A814HDA5_ADIRI|nr:unnamed protein product [Adineta ricciae]
MDLRLLEIDLDNLVKSYIWYKNLADSYAIPYVETSAKSLTKIEEALWNIFDNLITNIPDKPKFSFENSLLLPKRSGNAEAGIDLEHSSRIVLIGYT